MELRILGPLEVRDDGRAIELGAAKVRALLAVLCLNANRVVSTDALIESLWGERVPETAPKALQVYVSQLRKALGRDRILTRSPGYELRIEAGELDLHRFERLVAEEEFHEALGLWRGAALADFAYEPFAQSERARLEELRLSCLERRIERDLAGGKHAALVGELDGLVREHPLRERLRAQLMLALYRSQRQADALEVYQVGRGLLSDELGLEPSAELKELQRRILSQDVALDLPASAPPAAVVVAEPSESRAPTRARETRKTVTVLSCDVTVTGHELDPESLGRMTARGLDEIVSVLERHGATVESSLGGAVSAIFGVPVVNEDDPLRAVRAAVESRERIAVIDDELAGASDSRLALRVGIGTGEVVAASDGARPLAAGRPVQEAMRLQQAADAGELLIDERTLHLVRASVEAETLDDRIRLVSVAPVERGRTGRIDAPMVGRGRELRRLHDAFEQARSARSCQLFTVLGAPGVGKSRLVSEFVGAISDSALVARGRCLPYGEGITYWPIVEAVRDAAGLDDAASSDANLAKLGAILQGTADAKHVADRLGEIVGQSDRSSTAEEIAAAIRFFIEAMARHRPLVLVLDDIHWGEATFLDLVDHVADWVTDAPVLIVCMARPELLELRAQWGGGKLNATSVLLEPLSDDESESLVHHLAGSADLGEETCRRIVEAAGGNPLFVEEMLALLVENGGDRDVIAVPPTIQALLATRLDRLPDHERVVIEAAAVEGKVFHEGSVAELSGAANDDVHRSLLALARRDLIRSDRPVLSGERAFRFRHLLIRDAAYESIPKSTRATLHARHAVWLDTNIGDRSLELDEIVGYHYEQAFKYRDELGSVDGVTRELGREAATRLGSAGRRALLRSDSTAGVNLISRSAALLEPDDPLRVELIPSMRVIQGVPDLSWADRVLTEAIEAAATSGDKALAAHALVQRGFLRLFVDEDVTPRELFDVAERAIAVFDSLGDELGLARAWRLVAQAHYLNRHGGRCAEASERALTHIRRARDRFEEREIVEWLVIAFILGPTHAGEALDRCRELIATEWEDPLLAAEVAGAAAALAAMLGLRDEAEELMERARSSMHEAGEWIWIVSFWYSFIGIWHGDPAAAEAELRPAYDALEKIGEKSHFSSIAHGLAAAVYAQGRLKEAEQLTRECEAACRANDIHSQILWRSIRAKVLARRGEAGEADRLVRQAIAFAETSDFLHAHADALIDLAQVRELAGDLVEASWALEQALMRYEQKGNALAGDLCRTELARLKSQSASAAIAQ